MIRISTSTMFFHEYTLPEIFSFCHDAGLDTIEFWFETPEFWLAGMPSGDLAGCLAAYPCFSPVTCHMPVLDLNPCSINPRVAEATRLYATECYALAEDVSASVYTVHPGRRTAKRPPSPADYRRLDSFLSAMRQVSSGSYAKVAIENMEPKINTLLSDPQEVRELLDREPWLFFTLDVSHAMNVSVEEVIRYLELCSDRLVNIHMSVPGPGGRNHYPLNRSDVITPIIEKILDIHYGGVMTLEIEDRNFDRQYTSREKIEVIKRECSFFREFLGETR